MTMFGDQRKINVKRLQDGTSTTDFARRDGTWAAPTASVSDGNKGDVTVSSSGTVWRTNNVITKVMTSDQSINSSTTLTNVTDLVFAIGAGETWTYQFAVQAGDVLSLTGYKVGATMPAGASGVLWLHATSGVGDNQYEHTATPSTGVSRMFGSDDSGMLTAYLTVVNAGTAGNVQLQFAQSTSDGTDLTFKQGSFGIGHKAT